MKRNEIIFITSIIKVFELDYPRTKKTLQIIMAENTVIYIKQNVGHNSLKKLQLFENVTTLYKSRNSS